MTADLHIPGRVLSSAKISGEELLMELAVYLYDSERLSMGQARNLVRMDVIAFQQELARRGIDIKYGIDDFEDDLSSLERLRS